MNKAVFLDRDGVINEDRTDYVKSINELVILPGVPEAIRLMNESGYTVFVVTNQSAVNQGIISREMLIILNQVIFDTIYEQGGRIEVIASCPHTDEDNCECRKPKPGLITEILENYQIDLSPSYMIGDRWTDLDAGHRAGIPNLILIDANWYNHCDECYPPYVDTGKMKFSIVPDLLYAAKHFICNQ